MAKLYDTIKQLLEVDPKFRDSDKHLIWAVWRKQGLTIANMINFKDFLQAISPESITRARRKVQEDNPNLTASKQIKTIREDLEEQYRKDEPDQRELF